jgi:Cna protein B-type domain.
MPRRYSLLVCLTALLLALPLYGQFDSGQISGYVRDTSEAIVPDCVVTAVNEGTREQHQTTTNSAGYYVFPNLPVGTYSLTAEVTGFKKSTRTAVNLSSAGKMSVDFSLLVGSVSESVEVSASTSQVQTETAQVGRTIESKQIQDLTLNGRNPIYLALLKPGVQGGSISTFDPDSVSNGGFSINGGRADEYVVMVDGAVAPARAPQAPCWARRMWTPSRKYRS